MKRDIAVTLVITALWALGAIWFYDCKIKRVCGPEKLAASTASAALPPPVDAASAGSPATMPAPSAPSSETAAATTTTAPITLGQTPAPDAAPATPQRPSAVLTVTFDARSAAIQPPTDVEAKLEVLRRGIAEGRKIIVLGHSDGRGARARIAVVSQERADALRDWLLTQGFTPADIAAVESREDREPIASNSRPEGRSANRRAEAVLTPIQ